jgi:hypothetical protein
MPVPSGVKRGNMKTFVDEKAFWNKMGLAWDDFSASLRFFVLVVPSLMFGLWTNRRLILTQHAKSNKDDDKKWPTR